MDGRKEQEDRYDERKKRPELFEKGAKFNIICWFEPWLPLGAVKCFLNILSYESHETMKKLKNVLYTNQRWGKGNHYRKDSNSLLTSSPADAWKTESGTDVGEGWCPQFTKSSSFGVPTLRTKRKENKIKVSKHIITYTHRKIVLKQISTCFSDLFNLCKHPETLANPPISSWSEWGESVSVCLSSTTSCSLQRLQFIFSWISELNGH